MTEEEKRQDVAIRVKETIETLNNILADCVTLGLDIDFEVTERHFARGSDNWEKFLINMRASSGPIEIKADTIRFSQIY